MLTIRRAKTARAGAGANVAAPAHGHGDRQGASSVGSIGMGVLSRRSFDRALAEIAHDSKHVAQ